VEDKDLQRPGEEGSRTAMVSPCQKQPHGTSGSAWGWQHSTPMGTASARTHCLQLTHGHHRDIRRCAAGGCGVTRLWDDGGQPAGSHLPEQGVQTGCPTCPDEGACTTHGL